MKHQRTISKSEFIELAKKTNRNQVSKHFNISNKKAQELADMFGVSFQVYDVKLNSRPKKYKIID
jgi:hypothetical protein